MASIDESASSNTIPDCKKMLGKTEIFCYSSVSVQNVATEACSSSSYLPSISTSGQIEQCFATHIVHSCQQ